MEAEEEGKEDEDKRWMAVEDKMGEGEGVIGSDAEEGAGESNGGENEITGEDAMLVVDDVPTTNGLLGTPML